MRSHHGGSRLNWVGPAYVKLPVDQGGDVVGVGEEDVARAEIIAPEPEGVRAGRGWGESGRRRRRR